MNLRQIIQTTQCLLKRGIPIDLIEIIINYATDPKEIICSQCVPDNNRCHVCYKCMNCDIYCIRSYICGECSGTGWYTCAKHGNISNDSKNKFCHACYS